MSGDNPLWLQSWREQRIDFHQSVVNPMLSTFWPSLQLPRGSRVFVPLCGKSLDMLWLAQQGHRVIGVELSPIAVRDFFQENGLQPVQRSQGACTLWQHGDITILCGDYFSLQASDLGPIDVVYDRAALTALPEELRVRYVTRLQQLVKQNAQLFLLTVEDAEEHESLQQAMGVSTEIAALYAQQYQIQLTHVESLWEADERSPLLAPLRVEYKVYRMINHHADQAGKGV